MYLHEKQQVVYESRSMVLFLFGSDMWEMSMILSLDLCNVMFQKRG